MSKTPSPALSMERSKAFSDGVLAVLITILVLGLEVPEGHDFDRDGLVAFLGKMFHDMHPYVGSFMLIATYWVQHTVIFHYIGTGRRSLVWLNLVFLLVMSPIPFMTELRASYPNVPIVVLLFGSSQVLCGLMLFVLWNRAVARAREISTPIDVVTVRSMRLRILLGPAIIVLGSLAAFVDTRLATLIYLGVPMLYVSHRQVDERWQMERTRASGG